MDDDYAGVAALRCEIRALKQRIDDLARLREHFEIRAREAEAANVELRERIDNMSRASAWSAAVDETG